MTTPQSPARVEIDQALPELPKHVGSTVRGKTRNAKWTHTMLNDSLNFPGGEKLYTADQMRAYATEARAAERAEVVRLSADVEKLRAALSDEKTAFYAGYGAAHDDINNSRAPVIQIAWDRRAALATTTQGEPK